MKFIVLILFTVLIVIGCSKKSGEDYLKSAEENMKNNKLQEAVADYENFVKENPQNEKAPDALSKLASIYQSKMLKNISDRESFEKAANYYKKVFDDYPSSKQAPASLFMSAFVLANELKKYHLAEVTYHLFLQKFQNHELANSAREELENLGLSPEEILKKKNSPNI